MRQNWESNQPRGLTKWAPRIALGAVGAMGALSAAPAIGAMFSGGGAASGAGAGWTMPGVSPPVFGGLATTAGGTTAPPLVAKAGLGARLGSMFNSNGMNLGVNAGLSLLGHRSENRAADQARRDTLAANAEAIKVQREQLELEARNSTLDREDARALNAAINALRKQEFDALQEQRAFDRGVSERAEGRIVADVARREPYRQRGVQALDRLAGMWGLS